MIVPPKLQYIATKYADDRAQRNDSSWALYYNAFIAGYMYKEPETVVVTVATMPLPAGFPRP